MTDVRTARCGYRATRDFSNFTRLSTFFAITNTWAMQTYEVATKQMSHRQPVLRPTGNPSSADTLHFCQPASNVEASPHQLPISPPPQKKPSKMAGTVSSAVRFVINHKKQTGQSAKIEISLSLNSRTAILERVIVFS